MSSWLKSLIWRGIRSTLRRHPSYEEFLALRDGELSQVNSRRTAAHLERCSLCHGERNRIEEDILRFKAVDQWVNVVGQPHVTEGLERLQRTIQAWEAFHSDA